MPTRIHAFGAPELNKYIGLYYRGKWGSVTEIYIAEMCNIFMSSYYPDYTLSLIYGKIYIISYSNWILNYMDRNDSLKYIST